MYENKTNTLILKYIINLEVEVRKDIPFMSSLQMKKLEDFLSTQYTYCRSR